METYNLPAKPKVLVFDIDSTLYTCPKYAFEQIDCQVRHYADLNGLTHENARKMIRELRKKWASEHDGKKISLGNLFVTLGVSIETSIEWRKTLFDPFDYLKKDERLIKTMAELSKSFYSICVTNNPVLPARKTLEAIGISQFIPHIVGLDTCFASKPSEKILEKALLLASEDLRKNISYSECISVGDRFDIDLDLPLRLGMGGILVSGVEDVWDLHQKLPQLVAKN